VAPQTYPTTAAFSLSKTYNIITQVRPATLGNRLFPNKVILVIELVTTHDGWF